MNVWQWVYCERCKRSFHERFMTSPWTLYVDCMCPHCGGKEFAFAYEEYENIASIGERYEL
jgi:Zn finger protein HypA/HybF involved in hydrogenase expression